METERKNKLNQQPEPKTSLENQRDLNSGLDEDDNYDYEKAQKIGQNKPPRDEQNDKTIDPNIKETVKKNTNTGKKGPPATS